MGNVLELLIKHGDKLVTLGQASAGLVKAVVHLVTPRTKDDGTIETPEEIQARIDASIASADEKLERVEERAKEQIKKAGGTLALLVALSLATGCAAFLPKAPTNGGPVEPVIVEPVVVPPAVAILTVEVEPKAATVFVSHQSGDAAGLGSWPTRPNGQIVEEFPATLGSRLRVWAEAPGYLQSEAVDVPVSAGHLPIVRIVLKPEPRPQIPRLVVKGRQFYDGETGALYVPRWVSGLRLLARSPEQQDRYLRWASGTGFNGVRVFAGALTWAGQTAESARAALPGLLDRAAEYGLVVEVTAITDSGTGYDAREHVRLLAGLLTGRRGVVFELANEIGHGTQSPDITVERMRAWGRELVPEGVPWAVGATLGTDEPCPAFYRLPDIEITWDEWKALAPNQRNERPAICEAYGKHVYPAYGGTFNTAHLDRGRVTWNQVRRVREIYAIAESHGSPAINNEPIGCAEPGTGGQRWNDPALFFALGALDRAFGVGGVHHSQAGLMSELPGPTQQACADVYVWAHNAIDSVLPGVVGQYKNVGHGGSPIASARFVDGGEADGVVRAYSFISGDRGVVVLIGVKGDAAIEWAGGWRAVATLRSIVEANAPKRAVTILEIARRH